MKHLKALVLLAVLSFSLFAAHAQNPSAYEATVAKLDKNNPISFFYTDGQEIASGIRQSLDEAVEKIVPEKDLKKVQSILNWVNNRSGFFNIHGYGGSLVRQGDVYKLIKFAYSPARSQNGLLWKLPGANINTLLSVIPQNALSAFAVKINPNQLYSFISDFSKILKNDEIREAVHSGAVQFSEDILNPYELTKQLSGFAFFCAAPAPKTAVNLSHEDDDSELLALLPDTALIIELKNAEYWDTLKSVIIKSGLFEYDSAANCFNIASGITLFCQKKFIVCTNIPDTLKKTISNSAPNLLSNPEFKKYADVLTTTNGFALTWTSKDCTQLTERIYNIVSAIDDSISEDFRPVKPVAGISLFSKNREGMTFRSASDSKNYALLFSGTNAGSAAGFMMTVSGMADTILKQISNATNGLIVLPGSAAARRSELETYGKIVSAYFIKSGSNPIPLQDGVDGFNLILKSFSASNEFPAGLSEKIPLDGSLKEDASAFAFFSPYQAINDIDEDDLENLPLFIEKPWVKKGSSVMLYTFDGSVMTLHGSFSTLEDVVNDAVSLLDLSPEVRSAYIKKAKALDIKCGFGPK